MSDEPDEAVMRLNRVRRENPSYEPRLEGNVHIVDRFIRYKGKMFSGRGQAVALYLLLAVTVAIATAVRVAPLLEGGERLRYQCVSEDGYLMLTIARNTALGRGFCVSDGLIPSNGTQPLAALLYAFCFVCVGGDKVLGLYPVVGLQVVISILTAVLLFVFVGKYLYKGPHAVIVALLAACVWYASPTSIMHTQNGLETGLYALLILSSVLLYGAIAPRLRASLGLPSCLLLGLVLGVTFLGRNDACFLIAGTLAVHLILAYQHRQLQRALVQALIIGATSVLVSLPWLWFNLTRFGHIIPISGRAEALHVDFAHNLLPAFVAVLENSLLVLRIPASFEEHTAVITGSCIFLVVTLIVACVKRDWLAERFTAGMGVLACFAGALFVYYALFFGMPSFLGRYFFAITIPCSVVGAAVLTTMATRATRRTHKALIVAAALTAAVACCGLDARIYARGTEHLHSQVVDWVAKNVAQDTWVAAIQTGALGYYHDNTINLDGKVDPYALAARGEDRTHEYAIDRNVEYIVDWVGIAKWAELPGFAENYQLVLSDYSKNLAVLQRKPFAGPSSMLGMRRE